MPALNLDGAVGAKERRPSLLDPEALREPRPRDAWYSAQ